jgi:hypothetical protein
MSVPEPKQELSVPYYDKGITFITTEGRFEQTYNKGTCHYGDHVYSFWTDHLVVGQDKEGEDIYEPFLRLTYLRTPMFPMLYKWVKERSMGLVKR